MKKKEKINTEKKKIDFYKKYGKNNYKKRMLADPNYSINLNLKQRKNRFESYLFSCVKSSAKKRGLEFNLTIDDIVIPTHCPYLEKELTRIVGSGKKAFNPSIDRIDNSKGYLKDNIMIISNIANVCKSNLSKEDLILFAKNAIKIHSKIY